MIKRTFNEKIVLISCILGLIVIIPFSLYRFMDNDYTLAFIESCMAFSISATFAYTWKTHNTKIAAPLISSIYLGFITIIHFKDHTFVYWMFPVMLSLFFVIQPRTALLFSLVSMILVFPALYPTLPSNEVLLIYSALATSSLLGYTYTWITTQKSIELSNLASVDGLTGTGNRRALDEALESLLIRHKHQPIKASLIIMDLDHFKNINDTYGHGVGDHILIE